MFLIAGLGNPDKKYEKTRHIIGLIPSMHWQKNTTSASRRKNIKRCVEAV